MANTGAEHPDLERYLDGQLEGAALKAFENACADNPALRAALAQIEAEDAALTASLKRSFAPPETTAEQILTSLNRETKPIPTAATRLKRVRKFAVAAALLLGLAGTWMIFDYLKPQTPVNPYDSGPYQTLPEIFARAEADTLEYWVCADERQFATTFYQQFGHAARLAPELPAGLTALGLSYVNSITEKTIIIRGEFGPESKPVIIVIDRLADDDGTETAKISPDSGIKIYRRAAPPLVFYEISRLDKPHFLEALQAIEMPTEWIPGRRFRTNPPKADESDQ